jgi:hypothetical protein
VVVDIAKSLVVEMPSPDELLELYNKTDIAKRSALAVPEVQAFSTTTFDQIGWPHSVARAADLVRYADWCNHPGANDYFADNAYLPTQCSTLLFTADEVRLLRRIADGAAVMTRSLGQEVRPLLNHLAQIGPFRIMMEIRKRLGRERLTVFDVGAGSGYQAALLALAGNQALLTDNAQGLYLFQSLFMKACCGDEAVRDWVVDGRPEQGLSELVHMVPWWDYLGLRHTAHSDVDIFFCNNNLGEMNYAAAAYTAFLAKKLMASSKVKMFLFTCIGSPKQSAIEMIDELLKRAGFVNVVWGPFWLYTLKGHSLPANLFDFASDIPKWAAEPGGRLYTVREVIDADKDTLPTDLDFVTFTGVFDPAKYLPLKNEASSRPIAILSRLRDFLMGDNSRG